MPYKEKKVSLQLFSLLLFTAISISSYAIPQKQKKILVFSKTAGFRHTSAIDAGKNI
jgi:hypothetical protein